ncbi:hypothetical protein BDR07DRAFT_1378357 [Suillus spraguei]|nr:hypothetical protein BDR07DRAFT_1378357 [Suillus spraguei]
MTLPSIPDLIVNANSVCISPANEDLERSPDYELASEDLNAISTDWLKILDGGSSTRDATSFVSHFHSNGWLRAWTLSGSEKICRFLSEVVDEKPRLEHSGLREFKLDDHTVNAPLPFKLLGPQCIEGVQGFLPIDARCRWEVEGFNSLQDLVGHEESSADQHGLYEGQKMTWGEDVDAKFCAIEADPTVLIGAHSYVGFGIRALVIEKSLRVGDSWRQWYPNLTLHTPAYQSSILYSPYLTTFPKYIPKGKLANFLDSYTVNQELCIWLSSSIASTPVKWKLEFLLGMEWMNFKEPCIIPTSIKMQSNSEANALSLWACTAEQTHFKSPFPDGTPIEELDFYKNSMPLVFLQVTESAARRQELCFDIDYSKLIVEGRVKIKQGQDISHFDRDGITFKDGSKLSADVIVLAYGLTGNEPIMKTARALLGNEITEQLPPEVMSLDSEGEYNQIYRPSGHPGLRFASGGFLISRFYSRHLHLSYTSMRAREVVLVRMVRRAMQQKRNLKSMGNRTNFWLVQLSGSVAAISRWMGIKLSHTIIAALLYTPELESHYVVKNQEESLPAAATCCTSNTPSAHHLLDAR